MSVILGHAVASENNNKYGNPGNQNGKELRFSDWYNEGWNVVLRPISKSDAEKIAKAMEVSVNNKNIGYDQRDRTTYYTEASKVGFDLTKVKNLCECDCSSLVSVCVNTAGIKVSKDIYTRNMVKALLATGKFEQLPKTKQFLSESSYLMRGDILVHEGSHTAIVLVNGSKIEKYEDVDIYGIVTAFWLNVRDGASSKTKSIKTIKKNTVVHITRRMDGWGYIEEYKGWVSLSHIKKQEDKLFSSYIAKTTTSVNIRTVPNSNSKSTIITKLVKDQVLLITKDNVDGWVYGKTVIKDKIVEGWIFSEHLSKTNSNDFKARVVTDATGLNVRDKGNIKANKICTIPYNEKFSVVTGGTWGVVTYKDKIGFCNLSNCYSKQI